MDCIVCVICREISNLLPLSGRLLFPDSECNTHKRMSRPPLGIGVEASAVITVYGFTFVDLNALLWRRVAKLVEHLSVGEAVNQSKLLWFAGGVAPPPRNLTQRIPFSSSSMDSTLAKKSLSDLSNIVQLTLRCLIMKTVYKQLCTYICNQASKRLEKGIGFDFSRVTPATDDGQKASTMYICRYISEVLSEDYRCVYGSKPSQTESASSGFADCYTIKSALMTLLCFPMLKYCNMLKYKISMLATATNPCRSALSDKPSSATGIPMHLLPRQVNDLNLWSKAVSSQLSENEAGEALAQMLFEILPVKAVKIMHSSAPHRAHDSSLKAVCVLYNDVIEWLGKHMKHPPASILSPADVGESSPGCTAPSALGVEVVDVCQRFAANYFSSTKELSDLNVVDCAGATPPPVVEESLVDGAGTGALDAPDDVERDKEPSSLLSQEVGMMCSPAMLLVWLESKLSILTMVVKPAEAFNSSTRYLQYIEPWSVEPWYTHQQQQENLYQEHLTDMCVKKNGKRGKSRGIVSVHHQVTVGRHKYNILPSNKMVLQSPIPIVSSVSSAKKPKHLKTTLYTGGVGTTSPIASPKNLKKSPKSDELLRDVRSYSFDSTSTSQTKVSRRGSQSDVTTTTTTVMQRELNIAELVLSAYLHDITDSMDASCDFHDLSAPEGGFMNGLDDLLSVDGDEDEGSATKKKSSIFKSRYCQKFLSLWYGVRGEEWLVQLVEGLCPVTGTQESPEAPICIMPLKESSSTPHLLAEKFTPFHISIATYLYRNAIYYQLCMTQRYVAVLEVTLLNLKDIGSIHQTKKTEEITEIELYAVAQLCPSTRRVTRNPSTSGNVHSPVPIVQGSRSNSSSASPSPPPTKQSVNIPINRTMDSFVTPVKKLSSANNSGHSSGGGVDYDWKETIKFRFPLPIDSVHLNANSDGIDITQNNNYLHKLYDCPDMVTIDVFQKPAYSFASALGGLIASGGVGINENCKIGELQIPLGSFFAENDVAGNGLNCSTNLSHCDWYPLTHLSEKSASGGARNSDSVWLLHMEINLKGCLMSCV